MKIPKMVLFDYGQTLIAEQKFDGINGTEAVLQYATRNKYHLSAEQIQAKADEINRESQGIEIALSNSEIDTVFWNAAAPGVPTEGIKDFLGYLKNKDIRTGVISNISYAPSVVAERINRLLPENTLQPDEVWYIGDQYECDVKGSLNAGLQPIWYIGAIDLPHTVDKNILTVKTWSEIEQYVEG